MIETIFNILHTLEPYAACYGALVALCTTIVKATSTTKDDAAWEKVIKVLDFFSTAFRKIDLEKIEQATKENKK